MPNKKTQKAKPARKPRKKPAAYTTVNGTPIIQGKPS